MRRDLHSNIKAVQHLAAVAATTTQTPASGVDLRGFDAAEFVITIGTITNIANSPAPSWSFKLQESDAAATDFADVTDSAVVLVGSAASPVTAPDASSGVFLVVDSASEDGAVYRVGYVGTKRYVRVVATAANTPGATPLAILALLGKPGLAPTAD